MYDDVVFAYLVAIPSQLFSFKNVFSILCLFPYIVRLYSRWSFRFFFGGITTSIFLLVASSTISFVSYTRFASKYWAYLYDIRLHACELSALVPLVIVKQTSIPSASTARCIFVLNPLLCDPYLDCHLLLLPHVNGLWYKKRQSLTTRNLGLEQISWIIFPKYPYLAIARSGDSCFSNLHTPKVNLSKVRLFSIPKWQR